MYIYIFLFTDIIYNTPAQKVYFTQIPLHSWCLEKKPGCSSRAFAWLCAVTWTEMQKIWPHGWSDPVVNKKWFINMKFCSPTCPKLFKWICLNVFFWSQVGGKMRTWLPKFGMDRWKLFWQLVIYSTSTSVMIENIAGQADLLLWSIVAWFCLHSDKLRITLITEFSCS